MISLRFLILLILMITSVHAELVLEIIFPDEKPEIVSLPLKANGTAKKAFETEIEYTALPASKEASPKREKKKIGKMVEVHSCTLMNQIASIEISAHQTKIDQWIEYKTTSQTLKIPDLIEQNLAPLKLDLTLGVWQTIGGTTFAENGLPLTWKVKVIQR